MSIEDSTLNDLAKHYDWTVREMQRIWEYAKNKAVEFELWTQSGECEWQLNDEDEWLKYPNMNKRISTEELFEIFIKNSCKNTHN